VKAAELLGFRFTLVVGWTDPEGSRPYLGALLLAYYDPDERLVYAGRAGAGIKQAELARLWRRLQPLATSEMPLAVPPPRNSRFGSPLVLTASTGSGRNSSPKSSISPGPPTICCGRWSMKGYARTSRRPRCDVRCRIPHQSCPQ
jgi:hypothetical protein